MFSHRVSVVHVVHAHTHTGARAHTHLSTRMVPTADPALFRVVDRQGEADLERPVPCLLHQFGVYHLHGESREAEGAVYQGRRHLPGWGQPSMWQLSSSQARQGWGDSTLKWEGARVL